MLEFLIQAIDGPDLDFIFPEGSDPLRTESLSFRRVDPWTIEIDGHEISVSHESVGVQLSFEAELPLHEAGRVVEAIRRQIEKESGQRARSVQVA